MSENLRQFMESSADGVFIVGHASALVRVRGDLILFDPAWGDFSPYGAEWIFWPAQENLDSILDQVDRIVISHEHADHLCEPVLRRARCTVHIMEGRPRLRHRIEACGRTCVEHPARQWRWFTRNCELFFLEHPFNGVDSFPVIRSNDFTVSLGSDCFLDDESLEILQRACPPIDVALVPHAFIHWWPFLQEGITAEEKEKRIQTEVAKCQLQAELFLQQIQPKIAVATGDSLYHRSGSTSILNRHLFETPLPHGLTRLYAGSSVLMHNGKPITDPVVPREKFPPPVYSMFPKVELSFSALTQKQRATLAHRLGQAERPSAIETEVIVNGLVLDPQAREAKSSRNPAKGYYRFDFAPSVFRSWLDGEISFEQALGTRRFEFRRDPDLYLPSLFHWFNTYL